MIQAYPSEGQQSGVRSVILVVDILKSIAESTYQLLSFHTSNLIWTLALQDVDL